MKISPQCTHLERLIWVTGLPASGKTTVARILSEQLVQKNYKVLRLDGDQLRNALKSTDTMLKYDADSRLKNALTYSALAKSLLPQFDYIILSTISMFRNVYITNRKTFLNYFEVYLNVPYEVRSSRDPKGLYKSFATETSNEFFGESLKVDIPKEAHFTHDYNPNDDACDVAQKIETLSQEHFEKILRGQSS